MELTIGNEFFVYMYVGFVIHWYITTTRKSTKQISYMAAPKLTERTVVRLSPLDKEKEGHTVDQHNNYRHKSSTTGNQ